MRIIILSTILVSLLIAPVQILAQNESPLITNPYTNRVSGTIAVTPGHQKSYYDAHPEERARNAATQANKPLMDMQKKLIEDMRTRQQGYGTGSYGDYSTPSPPPPPLPVPSTPGVLIQRPGGAISAETGDFYPKSGRGLIDPKTGGFLPDVGGGYIDPSTGRFIPKK